MLKAGVSRLGVAESLSRTDSVYLFRLSDGRFAVFGGTDAGADLNNETKSCPHVSEVLTLDGEEERWDLSPKMFAARSGFTCMVFGECVIVAGDSSGRDDDGFLGVCISRSVRGSARAVEISSLRLSQWRRYKFHGQCADVSVTMLHTPGVACVCCRRGRPRASSIYSKDFLTVS